MSLVWERLANIRDLFPMLKEFKLKLDFSCSLTDIIAFGSTIAQARVDFTIKSNQIKVIDSSLLEEIVSHTLNEQAIL